MPKKKKTPDVEELLDGNISQFEQGFAGRAARLLGWADAARKRVGDTRPHGEQADIDRIISACLLKIGEEFFSDAYDAGQAMTMDEAVAMVLSDTKQIPLPRFPHLLPRCYAKAAHRHTLLKGWSKHTGNVSTVAQKPLRGGY